LFLGNDGWGMSYRPPTGFLIKKKNCFLIKKGGQGTVKCPLPITTLETLSTT
jgi:hypothetical protein